MQTLTSGEGAHKSGKTHDPGSVEGEYNGSQPQKLDKQTPKRPERGKGKAFSYGREIDRQCDKSKIANTFWSKEIRVFWGVQGRMYKKRS